jgi:regulatory protein
LFKQRLTPLLAVPKIKHFCSYQERSHYEVKEKLISQLIEEDYLNEQRFAEQFTGGKFRQKQWGKIKIVYELKQKKVSEYNIKKALALIPIDDYKKTLLKLATTKWNNLKNEQYINREVKTTHYLLQKGYEHSFIKEAIQQLKEK